MGNCSWVERATIRNMKTTVMSRSADAKLNITTFETVLSDLIRHMEIQTSEFPNQVARNKRICKAIPKLWKGVIFRLEAQEVLFKM